MAPTKDDNFSSPGGDACLLPMMVLSKAPPRPSTMMNEAFKEEQRFEFFCQIFRIDGSQLQQDVVDRLCSVLKTLKERSYDRGQVIVEQGDASAPHEMLLVITGELEVFTRSPAIERRTKRQGTAKTHGTSSLRMLGSASAQSDEEESDNYYHGGPAVGWGAFSSTSGGSLPVARGRRGSAGGTAPPKLDAVRDERDDSTTITAPFFLGEERVLRNSWPTATYVVKSAICIAYVLQPDDVVALTATGGFSLERTLRLRSFERALAFRGVCSTVLRDAIFVEHFMAFLAKTHDVENLRFLVDIMKFKRDIDVNGAFDGAAARFDALWAEYFQPWGPLANVAAIDCPSALSLKAKQAADAVKRDRDTEELLTILDPVALRIKALLDTELLPAFIAGAAYSAFLTARFPLVDEPFGQPEKNQLQLSSMFKRIEGGPRGLSVPTRPLKGFQAPNLVKGLSAAKGFMVRGPQQTMAPPAKVTPTKNAPPLK